MIFLSSMLLLMLALSGCFGEVVINFTQTCPDFFADPYGVRAPPTVFTGNQYQQICQVRKANLHEYATFYDTANKIPVYSAYKFNGLMNCRRTSSWFIEPQLENRMESPQMECENKGINYQNQAVNADYEKEQGFHRGHLAPVYHARTQSCSDTTFTLTNAAPQDSSFNQGQWKVTEKRVAAILTQICRGLCAYIVTGVVPGNNRLKNRVSIPSHFWTAYCCLNNNRRVITSSGFLGENTNVRVQKIPVRVLDRNLTALYGQPFQVFGGNC